MVNLDEHGNQKSWKRIFEPPADISSTVLSTSPFCLKQFSLPQLNMPFLYTLMSLISFSCTLWELHTQEKLHVHINEYWCTFYFIFVEHCFILRFFLRTFLWTPRLAFITVPCHKNRPNKKDNLITCVFVSLLNYSHVLVCIYWL